MGHRTRQSRDPSSAQRAGRGPRRDLTSPCNRRSRRHGMGAKWNEGLEAARVALSSSQSGRAVSWWSAATPASVRPRSSTTNPAAPPVPPAPNELPPTELLGTGPARRSCVVRSRPVDSNNRQPPTVAVGVAPDTMTPALFHAPAAGVAAGNQRSLRMTSPSAASARDVCGLSADETRKVTRWATEALVAHALSQSDGAAGRPRRRPGVR
jgi:hypothetical protein